MEEEKIINYDDSIVTEINNKNFKLNINASNFSNEYYTVDYINSIFTALNNCCETCDSAINNIKLYFEKQSETENIVQPDLLNIDFLLEGSVNTAINDETKEIVEDSGVEISREDEESYNNLGGSSSHSSGSYREHFTQQDNFNVSIDGTKMITAKIVINASIFTLANLNSTVSSVIRSDTEVKIIGEENNMYKIIYGDNLEYIGYVSKDSIKDINVEAGNISEIKNAQIHSASNEALKVYNSSNLNSSNGDILKSGTNIKIISEQNNICKIIYGDSFDKIGYISKNYVS